MPDDAMTFGPVQRHHLVEWCAAENDYYPLHYDDGYAAAMGFDRPLIQGTYKFAAIAQVLAARFGSTAQLRSLEIRYLRADLVGTALRVRIDIKQRRPVDGGERISLGFRLAGDDDTETATGAAVIDCPTAQS